MSNSLSLPPPPSLLSRSLSLTLFFISFLRVVDFLLSDCIPISFLLMPNPKFELFPYQDQHLVPIRSKQICLLDTNYTSLYVCNKN